VLRYGAGSNPADIQGMVDLFRTDLGGVNNGVGGGPFTTGFRAIDWDGVPDASAAPNDLASDFFNTISPRGAQFATPGTGFQVSATAASGTAVRFGNIDPSYASLFPTFSAERLFAALGSPVMDINFFVPGSATTPGYVNGFGAVFGDVDLGATTSIELFDTADSSLFTGLVPPSPDGGLSFLGVFFNAGEQVARVRITSGNAALSAGVLDGGAIDLVVMDDFIYGEPIAVPEPGTWALLCLGALALMAKALRCRRS